MNLRYTEKKIRANHNSEMALKKNNWRAHKKWFRAAQKYHLLSIRNGEFVGVSMYFDDEIFEFPEENSESAYQHHEDLAAFN
jgi:hypothetical protein